MITQIFSIHTLTTTTTAHFIRIIIIIIIIKLGLGLGVRFRVLALIQHTLSTQLSTLFRLHISLAVPILGSHRTHGTRLAVHLYLPSAPRYKRLELFNVDLRLASVLFVLAQARLDPRMVQTVLDVGAFAHVAHKYFAYEVLGQIGRVAEVLVVEAVVDVGDVGECFLFGVAEER